MTGSGFTRRGLVVTLPRGRPLKNWLAESRLSTLSAPSVASDFGRPAKPNRPARGWSNSSRRSGILFA